MSQNKDILVLGGTGRQGGAVAKELLKHGEYNVRLFVRDTNNEKAKKLEKKGATLVKGDFMSKESLTEAMKGAYGVFSVQNYWETGKEKEIEAGLNVIQAAKEVGGIRHFIYSSVCCADKNTGLPHFDSKCQIEQHLVKSGLPYTILRPVYFMENYLTPKILEGIKNGIFYSHLKADTKLQLIAVRDIGKFALYVFHYPDKFKGQPIEIAADELTQNEIAQILNCKYQYCDINQLDKDEQNMYKWFETDGYHANIPELRKMIGELKDFKTWAQRKKLTGLPHEQVHRA